MVPPSKRVSARPRPPRDALPPPSPVMEPSAKTAHDLEWPALTRHLADRCQSAQGRDRALALAPAATLDEARARMRRTDDALRLTQRGEPLPLDALPDVRELLARLAREADATSHELAALRVMLHTAHALRRYGQARKGEHPALAAALASDPALDRLRATLDHALDPDGTLADRASADLAAARRKVHELRARIVQRLEEALTRFADRLQDRYYTLRDGRYVIPVRADAHLPVPGIVHGSSSSGATLFIEPNAVVTLGNQLRVLAADVAREEARVLAELTARARDHGDALAEAHEACVTADLLGAIVRLAVELRAVAVEPEAEPVLELRAARHPLIALASAGVVANDLAVRAGRVLVVSGPNAGGKTVALKTLGLAALMARAGLALPVAEGSRVGWFDPVACDVGDDQSIARNLSTFSAHVTYLGAVLAAARPGALVLLDELASGTDPEEGSALAAAVLESLAAQGAAVAVTTHYELLKTLAVRDERFENASVGFDLATMAPTFTVTLGIPGASSALVVAQRYGVPDAVVARARSLLPEHAGSREDVLRRLQDEERAARMVRAAVEDESRAIARLRAELEAERNALRAREQSRLSREGQELLQALRAAREELREAEQKLRRKKAAEAELREAERAIAKVAEAVSVTGPIGRALDAQRGQAPSRRPAREDDVTPGAKVFVPRLNAVVEVLERAGRDQVRVAAGPLKLFVALDEVVIDEGRAAGPPPTERPRGAPSPYDAAGDLLRPLRTESNTCDVRGLRVDDALGMVDAFLDRVYGAGGTAGFVLHGHGTGALKQSVREHLKQSPYILRARAADPEDGGDAFTVFWLKP
jgi:DNA mismatch repair protein MutS2